MIAVVSGYEIIPIVILFNYMIENNNFLKFHGHPGRVAAWDAYN